MGDIRIQRYSVSLRRVIFYLDVPGIGSPVFFSAVWGHWDVSYLKLAEMPYAILWLYKLYNVIYPLKNRT